MSDRESIDLNCDACGKPMTMSKNRNETTLRCIDDTCGQAWKHMGGESLYCFGKHTLFPPGISEEWLAYQLKLLIFQDKARVACGAITPEECAQRIEDTARRHAEALEEWRRGEDALARKPWWKFWGQKRESAATSRNPP